MKILFFTTGENSTNNICDYYDYIIEKILPKVEKEIVHLSNLDEFNNYNDNCDVFVYRCRDQKNYPWGYIPSYDDILKCVVKLEPKIIIQLADEFYHENLQQHNKLAHHCELFLRQFHHWNYEYFGNTLHIPLGYYNDFDLKDETIPLIKDRNFKWSFVGCRKSDRNECLDTFTSLEGGFTHLQEDGVPQQITRKDLRNIYLNTIFAPSPRGWTQLETCRIYESLMCGAIPVIVCDQDEYNITFKYHKNPPWIIAKSWQESVDICKNLMNDIPELQKLQKYNMVWWNQILFDIRNKVSSVLI